MGYPDSGFADASTRQFDSADDGVPIGAIFQVWWRRRFSLVLVVITGGILAILLAAGLFVSRPVSHQSILNFRLLFKGVEQGRYPDGERFAPSDILATAVLEQVYARNELSKFVKFDDFKNSLAVMANNPALNALRRDYEDRLAARALTGIDRQKLENEFQEKAAALQNAEFTLIIDFGSRFKNWPATMTAKILPDTINTWLELSRARGVFRLNTNIFSENILPVNSSDMDYLVFVDELRLAIKRVQNNIDDLLKVPGAEQIRSGAKRTSLGELRAQLDDTVKYKLGTLEATILQFGFYRNKDLTEAYLKDQIFRTQLATDELKAQAKVIEEVQSNYSASRVETRTTNGDTGAASNAPGTGNGAMITQLSDTFLDRVMSLSEKSSDVAFRQNLANRLIDIENKATELATGRKLLERQQAALSSKSDVTRNAASVKQWVETQLDTTLNMLKAALADLKMFHQELSLRDLDPGTAYELMGPVLAITVSPLGTGNILLFAVVLFMTVVGIGLLIVTWSGVRKMSDRHGEALS